MFDGWYLDASYNEAAVFPIDITQDMTLYAKWKEASDTTTTPGLVILDDLTRRHDAGHRCDG